MRPPSRPRRRLRGYATAHRELLSSAWNEILGLDGSPIEAACAGSSHTAGGDVPPSVASVEIDVGEHPVQAALATEAGLLVAAERLTSGRSG